MRAYQRDFLAAALRCGALRFGEFELKSGRISPYFFNAGAFCDGRALAELGYFYAQAVRDAGLPFDMLFGPAYKGIPLATALAITIWQQDQINLPVCFNRKEAKTHGEGGRLMGASPAGGVLVVDDVITAGTAIRESLAMIRDAGASVAGALIALDRRERGQGDRSAIQELEQDESLKVISIVSLDDLVLYLESEGAADQFAVHAERVRDYRDRYGVGV